MKQHAVPTPRIVQPGREYRAVKWLILLVLCVVAVWVWWPQRHLVWPDAMPPSEMVPLTRWQAVQDKLQTSQSERDELRLQLITAQRTHQVDQSALAAAQQELLTLQDERAVLRRELEFLKTLVSGDVTVLQLLDLKLWSAAADVPTYGYSLTVSKRAKNRTRVRGRLEISVSGQQDGQLTTLTMADLKIDPKQLSMNFTQFQAFSGELMLPDGFVPELITVAVKPKNKQFRQYQKDIVWRLVIEP
ncbi:MAG: DUF6776 family protein [Pseudomonadota bacterium]